MSFRVLAEFNHPFPSMPCIIVGRSNTEEGLPSPHVLFLLVAFYDMQGIRQQYSSNVSADVKGMEPCASGVQCGVVEWVKINTFRWFGHID